MKDCLLATIPAGGPGCLLDIMKMEWGKKRGLTWMLLLSRGPPPALLFGRWHWHFKGGCRESGWPLCIQKRNICWRWM